MKVAVVIPALHEVDRISAAIESARAPEVEIIVVDGGSRDATRALARAAGARVIEAPPGRAGQLQAGLRAASGDVVLFLHADTRLPPGWVGAVRRALADPAVAGGAFGFRFDRRDWRLRWIEWGARVRVALTGLAYGDQAPFARRRVLDAIGGVPQAPLMEDLDLVKALQRAGRFVVLPEPAVTSARRYLERGPVRAWAEHALALAAWRLGVDRRWLASWVGR